MAQAFDQHGSAFELPDQMTTTRCGVGGCEPYLGGSMSVPMLTQSGVVLCRCICLAGTPQWAEHAGYKICACPQGFREIYAGNLMVGCVPYAPPPEYPPANDLPWDPIGDLGDFIGWW